MQKYIGDIILDARKDTDNEDVPDGVNDIGIVDADFVRYGIWGQEHLQGLISKKFPNAFLRSKVTALAANQEEYPIDDHLYLGTRIRDVEYSKSGEASTYRRIYPTGLSTVRRNCGGGYFYHRRNGVIILDPIPSTADGYLRVTYERALDWLALRAGVVQSFTDTGTAITALAVDVTASDFLSNDLSAAQYLCINDRYGNVKMYNIPVSSFDPASGAFTMDSFTYAEGESLASGDYVTVGKYTTTHSDLEDMCARYLTEYISRRIFKRDSSDDAKDVHMELANIEKEIIESYELPDTTPKGFPVVDHEILEIEHSGADYGEF